MSARVDTLRECVNGRTHTSPPPYPHHPDGWCRECGQPPTPREALARALADAEAEWAALPADQIPAADSLARSKHLHLAEAAVSALTSEEALLGWEATLRDALYAEEPDDHPDSAVAFLDASRRARVATAALRAHLRGGAR